MPEKFYIPVLELNEVKNIIKIDPLRYEALRTIVEIAYEIAIGKRGVSSTKDDTEQKDENEQEN